MTGDSFETNLAIGCFGLLILFFIWCLATQPRQSSTSERLVSHHQYQRTVHENRSTQYGQYQPPVVYNRHRQPPLFAPPLTSSYIPPLPKIQPAASATQPLLFAPPLRSSYISPLPQTQPAASALLFAPPLRSPYIPPPPPPPQIQPATAAASATEPPPKPVFVPPQHTPLPSSSLPQPQHPYAAVSSSLPVPSVPEQPQSPRERYESLRAQGKVEYEQMRKLNDQSKQTRARGHRALARQLMSERLVCQQRMEVFHKAASELIFTENNKLRKPDEVDLHDLFVKEAEERVEETITLTMQRGDSQLRLIVGRGLHTADGIPKIKPAIEKLIQKRKLAFKCDSRNEGVLIVRLDGQGFEEVPRSGAKGKKSRSQRKR